MWPLVVVIAALLAERAWHGRTERAERRRFVNALLARTPQEYAALNRADVVTPKQREQVEADPIPIGLDG